MLLKFSWIIVILFMVFAHALADVRLPRILSGNMVLQRDAEFLIWDGLIQGKKLGLYLTMLYVL